MLVPSLMLPVYIGFERCGLPLCITSPSDLRLFLQVASMPGGGFSRVPDTLSPTSVRDEPADTPRANTFTLGDFAIDEYKPIKVVVIGGGFSGILAAIRFVSLPTSIPVAVRS